MVEEVRAPVSELERAEIPWVVAYLREDIQDLRNEVRENRRSIERLRQEIDTKIVGLDTKIVGLDAKIDANTKLLRQEVSELRQEMGVQLRWIIGIVIGAMVAMTGVFAWIVDRILTP
jgi:chromosome segregation ATPase